MKAIIVTDMGFGDSGKGSIVDALVRRHKSKLVIRATGGCQASHTVVTPDGKTHRFSQWGSGTLAGANTYLHKQMIIDPLAMTREAEALEELGVQWPYDWLRIHPNCLVTTRVHRDWNRNDQTNLAHGTCGMGIGATRKYWLDYGNDAIIADDLVPGRFDRLVNKFDLLLARLDLSDLYCAEVEARELCRESRPLIRQIEPWSQAYGWLRNDAVVIFEGAQGLLIDQKYGHSPYTTWSDVTSCPARNFIRAHQSHFTDVEHIGVIRAYMTRHGNGPLPTETSELQMADINNPSNEWQGEMRFGWPDLALLKYALECDQVDSLAVNCLDNLDNRDLWVRMRSSDADRWAFRPKNSRESDWRWLSTSDLLTDINGLCPISIKGYGPSVADKRFTEDTVGDT